MPTSTPTNYEPLTDTDTDFWDFASCRITSAGRAVNWFSKNARDIAAAKTVCATCPVSYRCLDFAINNNLTFYVFGGLDADERAAL